MLDWLKKALPEESGLGKLGPAERLIAAGALLVEAATLDANYSENERKTIAAILRRQFGLVPAQAEELLNDAENRHGTSGDLHRFTQAIKQGFEPEERIAIIEMLWEIAYSDGVLHHYEANLLRRVAGLIYVTDRDAGSARKRELARLNIKD